MRIEGRKMRVEWCKMHTKGLKFHLSGSCFFAIKKGFSMDEYDIEQFERLFKPDLHPAAKVEQV